MGEEGEEYEPEEEPVEEDEEEAREEKEGEEGETKDSPARITSPEVLPAIDIKPAVPPPLTANDLIRRWGLKSS